MRSAFRRRLTYANVVASLALVFAMSGGAYAAGRYLITSTKQINPKVLRALKGASGKAGAAGPKGAAGAGGPAGQPGAQGPQGPAGGPGKDGVEGKQGKEGKEGPPGPLTKTLPAGASETGAWNVASNTDDFGEAAVSTAVSFPIPLPEGLTEEHVFFVQPKQEGIEFAEQCPGSVASPEAASGDFCVYAQNLGEQLAPYGIPIEDPSQAFNTGGTARSGANIILVPGVATPTDAYGTWAVTAPA